MFMVDFFNEDGRGASLIFDTQSQAVAVANHMATIYDEVWVYIKDEYGWLPCLY